MVFSQFYAFQQCYVFGFLFRRAQFAYSNLRNLLTSSRQWLDAQASAYLHYFPFWCNVCVCIFLCCLISRGFLLFLTNFYINSLHLFGKNHFTRAKPNETKFTINLKHFTHFEKHISNSKQPADCSRQPHSINAYVILLWVNLIKICFVTENEHEIFKFD